MSISKTIVSEISTLLRHIETNYPGLYRNLDETATASFDKNQLDVDDVALKEYLQSLKDMLKRYQEEH